MTISETLDKDIIAIARAALTGQLDAHEAVKRIRRAQKLAGVARYGVAVEENELESARKCLGLAL